MWTPLPVSLPRRVLHTLNSSPSATPDVCHCICSALLRRAVTVTQRPVISRHVPAVQAGRGSHKTLTANSSVTPHFRPIDSSQSASAHSFNKLRGMPRRLGTFWKGEVPRLIVPRVILQTADRVKVDFLEWREGMFRTVQTCFGLGDPVLTS